MKHRIIIIALLLIMAAGTVSISGKCFAAGKDVEKSSIAGQWKLLPVLASDTATGTIPVLNFDVAARSFTGNTGCNSFDGKLVLNGDKLSFAEQSVLTRNTCPGYNEDAFMASLIKVNHFKIANGVLELMLDGTVLSKWVRKEPVNTVKKV